MEGTAGCHGLLDTLVRCLRKLYILQTMELGGKEPWDLLVPPIVAYREQLALWQLSLTMISESQHLGCGHRPVWPSSTDGVIKIETQGSFWILFSIRFGDYRSHPFSTSRLQPLSPRPQPTATTHNPCNKSRGDRIPSKC